MEGEKEGGEGGHGVGGGRRVGAFRECLGGTRQPRAPPLCARFRVRSGHSPGDRTRENGVERQPHRVQPLLLHCGKGFNPDTAGMPYRTPPPKRVSCIFPAVLSAAGTKRTWRAPPSPGCFYYLFKNNPVMALQPHFVVNNSLLSTRGAY